MSHALINHNHDLKKLRDEGYSIAIQSGFLLVTHIPYVNTQKQILKGTLVVKLDLAGDKTSKPSTHVAYFIGEYPCDANGKPIEKIRNATRNQEMTKGVTINHTFSAKPMPSGSYVDYHQQVFTYCSILSGPAQSIDPNATPRPFLPVAPEDEDDSVFNYVDTASSRAEIDSITQKLAKQKVAIIGLGGTGSYVLDFVAKTPVREIHIYDKDDYLTHNAFRSPGAPSLDELRDTPKKVNYFASIYSKMHRGIVPHAEHINKDNVDSLKDMDFVFVCMDDSSAKLFIIQKLELFNLSFVDVGMGVYIGDNALGGIVRVTTSTPKQRNHIPKRIPFVAGNDKNEYSTNIQIAELNALNATFAIIKWKKLWGFYADFGNEHHSTYNIEPQTLITDDRAA